MIKTTLEQVKFCGESPGRDYSEIESEFNNLSLTIDNSFKLINEIKERLTDILKPPMPETNNVAGSISDSPSSNIGMTLREKSYQLNNINEQIESIIKRLAI